jgi:hypothetical protein
MANNAQNPFAAMKAEVNAVTPWTRSLEQKAIHYPGSLTQEEQIMFAAQQGERRVLLRKQAEMIAANQGITLPPPSRPLNTRKI